MIDRAVLEQMGFVLSTDSRWGHEVWYHDSECWVHFGSNVATELLERRGVQSLKINGDNEGMARFFELFLDNYKNRILDHCSVVYRYGP